MPAEVESGGVDFEGLPRNDGPDDLLGGLLPRHRSVRKDARSPRAGALHPQKFEALIIEVLLLFFVSNARMSQRLSQEMRIPKLIMDALFERMHVSLGRRAARLLLVNSNGCHHVNRPLQDRVVQSRTLAGRGALFAGLRGVDLGIGAAEKSGFVEMRPIGFKNESGHAFR